MNGYSEYDIGEAGERIVVNALKKDRWIVNWNTKGPGATDIEAQKDLRKILIQVKTAIYPNKPAELSNDERGRIMSRAKSLGAEAWEAKVVLDSSLRQVGEIFWSRLS